MYVISGFSRLPTGHCGAAPAEVKQEFVHIVPESMIVEYVAGKIIEMAEEFRETVSHASAVKLAPKIIAAGSMIGEAEEADNGTFITIDKADLTERRVDRSLREFEPQTIQSLIEIGADESSIEEDEEDNESDAPLSSSEESEEDLGTLRGG